MGGLTALVGASLVARHLGVAEVANGCALIVGMAMLMSGQVALRLWRSGVSIVETAAWGGALVVAMVAPPLGAVFPGRPVVEGTLDQVGDAIRLPEDANGSVLIVATSDLPETSSLQFGLRVGSEELRGNLRRGAVRFMAGEELRHFHEDRWSISLSGTIPPGAEAIVLAERTAGAGPLRLRAYRPVLPPWILATAAVLTAFACAIRWARAEDAGGIVDTSLVGVLTGVLAASTMTPDTAVGATILGLLGGAIAGVTLGGLVRSLSGWVVRQRRGRPLRPRSRGGALLRARGGRS